MHVSIAGPFPKHQGESKMLDRLPRWLSQERICLQCGRPGFDPWVGKIPWRREWLPTPVFLPGEVHGQRSLAGYIVHGVVKSQAELSDSHILCVGEDVENWNLHTPLIGM